jgi:kynurenine formamidase
MGESSAVPQPDEAELLSWTQKLSNWGRWGPDDELGTLNYITGEQRRAAAALVRDGDVVSCAKRIGTAPSPDQLYGAPQRLMLMTDGLEGGQSPQSAGPRARSSVEYVGFVFHGRNITHLDALAHVSWDAQLYNGYPAHTVSRRDGATRLAVTAIADRGIVTRGILADIAALRGQDWLRPGEPVLPADLEAAEQRAGIGVGEGDVLLLRTGRTKARAARPDGELSVPGWHPTCLPWLHERRVALIGCDTTHDFTPSGSAAVAYPMHNIAIPTMGLWLLDHCDLEALAIACSAKRRWEFQFVLAPLPIEGATGSPVNPVAIF